ncbi:TonB-dependent receptor plug domain-containing protein [Novosphingobium lentum]|uniref:TonB-dependent receptor plug domain-containing protein n=1 Tax=Novosphingobium lentum TaxID=145287 RepID=UPI00083199F3|nr:TonB-dependent receptor [Novosphingobium lentum]
MKYLFSVSIIAVSAVSSPAFAQDASDLIAAPPRIVTTVVATGSETHLDQTGQAITVITQGEIDAVQGPDLTRVLERAPGVTITRNGGLGSFTGVRVRGAEAEQVLVLIDGVRVADVASPGGGYDFGGLFSGGIGKVELLRGSNSVVWGSAAIGGVIALTSREVNGIEASAEGGSHGSFTGDATAGLVLDRTSINLNGGYTRTDGISSAATGTEPDGFRQWHVGGRGRFALTDSLALVAVGRYADSRLDIDGFAPPTFSFGDTPEYQTTREASGRVGAEYRSNLLDLNAGYALSDTRRAYFDAPAIAAPNYTTQGRSERADVTGTLRPVAHVTLDFGADSERTRFSTLFDAEKHARLTSGHALLGYHDDGLDVAAGVRIDDHSRFGSATTLGANASYRLAPGLRVRASYGEGFKAPTLFQLLSDFGNTGLVPERSRSYDAGVEYGTQDSTFHAALTAFRRDSRNLIDFASCFGISTGICTNRPFGTYDNIGKARAEGFELELGLRPSAVFGVQAAYTYLKATNRTPGAANQGNDLARRPRNALTVSADWTPDVAGMAKGLTLGADVRLVSDSYDNASNFTRLDGYEVTTLRAAVPLGDRLELFGRIENLFDSQYQTAAGYGTYGRTAYAGVRVRY